MILNIIISMGLFDFGKKKVAAPSSSATIKDESSFSSSKPDFSSANSNNSGLTGSNNMYPNSNTHNKFDSHSYNPSDPFATDNFSGGIGQKPLDRDSHTSNSFHGKNDDIMSSKNMEIVLSKLDAIRLAIQNIDHRLSVIESRIDGEKNNHNSRLPDEDNIF